MNPAELTFARRALAPSSATSPELRVRWLGTAGFELSAGDHTILFDPYLTRASLTRCLLAPLKPDEALVARHLPRADAIVLGHTHFDHALDAPSIARRTGAAVFGSRSAAKLCLGQGVPAAQVEVVERPAGSQPVVREVGPFRLVFHASAHAPIALGRVPFEGEITDCDAIPMRVTDYLCGAVFGVEIRVLGKTLFHVGSAEILAGMPKLETDLALLCVAGWNATAKFPERVTQKLSPHAILLSHWDNFLRPLGEGARVLPAIQAGRLVERLSAANRDVRIGSLALMGELAL